MSGTSERRFPTSHLSTKEWAYIESLDPEFVRLMYPLRKHIFGDSELLPRKYKEMIHICILCMRGAPDLTLLAHIRRAKDEGATNAELLAALQVATISSGVPTLFHGVIALMKLEQEAAEEK